MQVHKILFPTDFSDGSDAALATATSLARDNQAKLLIVHVHEPNLVYSEGLGAAYGSLAERQRVDEQLLLDSVKPPGTDINFEHRLIFGTPADAVVRFAKEESADLIVMGTHGRTGVTRLLMGSVAEQVVRRSPCPVLTVREPSKEEVAG